MNKEMQELIDFTEAVCTAAMEDGAFYGALDKTAFRQYFIEVMMPVGKHWGAEEWFSDTSLDLRKQWGESIRSIYKLYQTKLAEAEAATVEPDSVKELRAELEKLSAQVSAMAAQPNKPEAPVAAPAGEETAGEA
jgi:hypothetical protein